MTMTIDRQSTGIDVSAFAPRPPRFHHEPLKVGDDTYLIRQLPGEGEAPMLAYVNSAVILGKEPVIVDTGLVNNREAWLNDVFSLVDPKDVRWIFISHDDHDHTGNLAQTLALCSNATLISSWFQVERLGGDFNLPMDRMRWIDDGGSFDAGDRTFAAIRPPIFDSPTTRGLYDSKTGIYWASDCFAAPVTQATDDVSSLHPEEWRQGFNLFHSAVSPWVHLVDAVKFNKTVCRLASLDIKTVITAHSPAIYGDYVNSAIDMLMDLPGQPPAQLPGQETLDQIVASLAGGQPA
jgi:flavorubredoxin